MGWDTVKKIDLDFGLQALQIKFKTIYDSEAIAKLPESEKYGALSVCIYYSKSSKDGEDGPSVQMNPSGETKISGDGQEVSYTVVFSKKEMPTKDTVYCVCHYHKPGSPAQRGRSFIFGVVNLTFWGKKPSELPPQEEDWKLKDDLINPF